MKRRLIVALVLCLCLVAMTGTAMAVVSKGGTQNCGVHGQTVLISSLGSGLVRHYAPSSHLQAAYLNQHLTNRSTATCMSNGTWLVTATGMLSSAGTSATCTGV